MGKKILVVDDEIEICELYKEILQENGHQVTIAADGIECGVNLLDNDSDFDAIIMDLNMPNQNGLKTIRYIKHGISKKNKEIKIIVVSALITEEIRVELEKYNVSYIDKPISEDKLLKSLED